MSAKHMLNQGLTLGSTHAGPPKLQSPITSSRTWRGTWDINISHQRRHKKTQTRKINTWRGIYIISHLANENWNREPKVPACLSGCLKCSHEAPTVNISEEKSCNLHMAGGTVGCETAAVFRKHLRRCWRCLSWTTVLFIDLTGVQGAGGGCGWNKTACAWMF